MVLLRTTWTPVLERASSLGFKKFRKWSWGLWKYVFRTMGRSMFPSLHARHEDQSSGLVFKTAMKTCCKQYLTALKWVSSLCFKPYRKLVFRALKIRRHNDGSVNVFQSSYTPWRPVFGTGLQDGYEDVLQAIFNHLEKGVKLRLQDV